MLPKAVILSTVTLNSYGLNEHVFSLCLHEEYHLGVAVGAEWKRKGIVGPSHQMKNISKVLNLCQCINEDNLSYFY